VRLFTTIFLSLCTAALGYWLALDMMEKSKTTMLDASGVLPKGSALFNKERVQKRKSITIFKKGIPEHTFQLNQNSIWECITPYQDRASGILYIGELLKFTEHSEVLESIPTSQINLADYGFNDAIQVTVRDIHDQIAAKYKIGISSAWKHRVISQDPRGQRIDTDFPTVYVLKEGTEDKNILYLVADPTFKIHSLFKNNFEGFRDHRPFALNRRYMKEITIKQGSREIVLDHSTSASPWRISKPLDLAVDKPTLKNFLIDLSSLTAVKLHPKDSITLPEQTTNLTQVSIKNFGIEELTTLTIYPPADENAKTTYSTVSDRNIVFELPTRPLAGFTSSVASLPTNVNALRARNMLDLVRTDIRGFIIRQPITQPIIIARPAPKSKYELLTVNGKRIAPNDAAIANLIAFISKDPVKAFVSDAATDLSIYGFQNPILTIDIKTFVGKSQKIYFARQKDRIYATLLGKNIVWEVDPIAYYRIAKNEWEWKHSLIWDIPKSDISQFTTQFSGKEKIIIHYDYVMDSLESNIGNLDVTSKLNPLQVKYFINTCTQLFARRRLGPNDIAAQNALANPLFTATIITKVQDEETTEISYQTHTLTIAKPNQKSSRPLYYFAKSSTDSDYFTITPATYKLFTTDLFSEE